MKFAIAACFALIALSGCAIVPAGPGVYVEPGPVVVRPGPVVVRPYAERAPRGHYHRW